MNDMDDFLAFIIATATVFIAIVGGIIGISLREADIKAQMVKDGTDPAVVACMFLPSERVANCMAIIKVK